MGGEKDQHSDPWGDGKSGVASSVQEPEPQNVTNPAAFSDDLVTQPQQRVAPRMSRLAERPGDTIQDTPRQPNEHEREANSRLGSIVAGAYRLIRVIGAGTGGAVFEARHEPTGEPVAVKLLHEGPRSQDQQRRFVREARAAKAIRHPNIINLIESGSDENGTLYQVLELLQGRDLAGALAERLLTPDEAVEVGRQLLSALAAVHRRGYVHRDVKPENVFLSQRPGGGLLVKLLDFGIAKSIDPNQSQPWMTMDGVILGTPSYMSPEQITSERPVTPASDIFSVGALLFDALTGHAVFEDHKLSRLLIKIASDPAPSIASRRGDLPAGLVHAVDKALQKRPIDRWKSAAEMSAALSAHGAEVDDLDWDD